MKRHRLCSASSGDTIVEVLIAIAVIGSVLGGAFGAVARSQRAIQQAKERGEALKIAEGQVEQVRVYSIDPARNSQLRTSGYFCMSDAGLRVPAVQSGGTITADANAQNISHYSSACQKNTSTDGVNYYVSIDPPAGGSNNVLIRVRWERLGGEGVNESRIAIQIRP